jgi:hypothetical protein
MNPEVLLISGNDECNNKSFGTTEEIVDDNASVDAFPSFARIDAGKKTV